MAALCAHRRGWDIIAVTQNAQLLFHMCLHQVCRQLQVANWTASCLALSVIDMVCISVDMTAVALMAA